MQRLTLYLLVAHIIKQIKYLSAAIKNIFILWARGSTLDVRIWRPFWRVKSIPALKE